MSDFDTFFEEIKQVAAILFRKQDEHVPLFYLQMANTSGLVIMPADWTDSADKARKFMMVRTGIEMGAVERCCLVHEMWIARYEMPASGIIDVESTPLPSERPDREEILMILGIDINSHRLGHWKIKRLGTKKKPQLGEFSTPDGMTTISDAFRGLIKNDGKPQ